jgi:hypothetical protein
MTKIEYVKSCFDNVQQLIRFADQKVGAALVLAGIEITLFYNLSKAALFALPELTFWTALSFMSGAVFIIAMAIVILLSILGVLRPRFAKTYKGQFSLYYFEHVATNTKQRMYQSVRQLTPNRQLRELSDQLYETSRILHVKNMRCSTIMIVLLVSVLSLLTYAFSMSR